MAYLKLNSEKRNVLKDNSIVNLNLDVELEEVEDILNILIDTNQLLIENKRVCYIFGYGGQTKKIYDYIQDLNCVEVIWQGFYGKSILKFLSFIVAGQGGIVKVKDENSLKKTFIVLTELSMASLFSFPIELEEEFLKHIRMKGWQSNPNEIILKNHEYIELLVDGDNIQSKTGIFLQLNIGKNISEPFVGKIPASAIRVEEEE